MRCKIAVAGVAAPGRVATSIQVRIHSSVDVRDKSRYKTQHANVDKSDLDRRVPLSAAIKLNASPEDDAKAVAALDTNIKLR